MKKFQYLSTTVWILSLAAFLLSIDHPGFLDEIENDLSIKWIYVSWTISLLSFILCAIETSILYRKMSFIVLFLKIAVNLILIVVISYIVFIGKLIESV